MIINRNNYKVNNAFIANDKVLNIIIGIKDKEITFELEDSYNNLGIYSLKFINVLGYNMTSFDFMEEELSISDFYINLDIKKYEYSSKFEDEDVCGYMEFVIELNNDDFIKVFCEKIDIDNKKVISVAN